MLDQTFGDSAEPMMIKWGLNNPFDESKEHKVPDLINDQEESKLNPQIQNT